MIIAILSIGARANLPNRPTGPIRPTPPRPARHTTPRLDPPTATAFAPAPPDRGNRSRLRPPAPDAQNDPSRDSPRRGQPD